MNRFSPRFGFTHTGMIKITHKGIVGKVHLDKFLYYTLNEA